MSLPHDCSAEEKWIASWWALTEAAEVALETELGCHPDQFRESMNLQPVF